MGRVEQRRLGAARVVALRLADDRALQREHAERGDAGRYGDRDRDGQVAPQPDVQTLVAPDAAPQQVRERADGHQDRAGDQPTDNSRALIESPPPSSTITVGYPCR